MPYIITTREPYGLGHDGPPPLVESSCRAVATLEEAREIARSALEPTFVGPMIVGATEAVQTDALTMAYHDAQFAADNLTASGGTIGPLPDGTVIEVRRASYAELHHTAGLDPTRQHNAIIAAFNAQQS